MSGSRRLKGTVTLQHVALLWISTLHDHVKCTARGTSLHLRRVGKGEEANFPFCINFAEEKTHITDEK